MKVKRLGRLILFLIFPVAFLYLGFAIGVIRGYERQKQLLLVEIEVIGKALESYKARYGLYPPEDRGLKEVVMGLQTDKVIDGRLMLDWFPKPIIGGEYVYQLDQSHEGGYDLYIKIP